LRLQNEEVQRFKARNHITDTAPGSSLNDQQMIAINTQIVQARSDLEQKLGMQRALSGRDPANSSQALASLTIQNLRAQQSALMQQEAELNQRYGPLYPKLQQIQVQRRDIDQRIAQEAARATGAINSEVDAARNHLVSLQTELAQAQGVAVNQGMARSELASLEANANSTRAAFEAFITRLRNAQDQDAGMAAESRVLSPATVPQSPTSPKRKLIVGAALPLGLMLGMLAALLTEKFGYLLRPKARRRNGAAQGRPARRLNAVEMTDWDGPPILGEINNAGALAAADYVLDWPSSRFAHASVALVRQLESRSGEGAVIALTAPEPGDHKSVVAVSLARAAARMGKKAVIIDCDPSHRSGTALHSQPQAGLYEVLTGAVTLNDALVKDPRSQAFLLTLKERPAQAAAMFTSPQMTRLVDILRDACDLVILDCSPALSGPDAALIARHADATILVSRREKLKTRSVLHATQILQDASAAPVGLVLAS
jgi:Mrp family chromosome partitioning ATPase